MSREAAKDFVERVRRELNGLDDKIRGHPYLRTLEAGQMSREQLQGFAGHQFHIIGSDLRSVALLLHRHDALPSRHFLSGLLLGELAALEALLSFAAALGMDRESLEAFEPKPGGVAYCWCVTSLAAYGSDAELAGAFLVNFAAWGANCGRMGKALAKYHGMKEDDLKFFSLFAETPTTFEQEALEVIANGLERGVPPRLITRAARLLQGCELMFWDAMREV